MIKTVRHTGIVVKDLKKSIYFYQDLLGFKITKEAEESGDFIDSVLAFRGIKVTTVKMVSPGGQMIELLYYHSHLREQKQREICDIGIAHIALETDDLNYEYKRLMEEGISFNSPPRLSPDNNAKVAFCRAPEGTFVELVEVI